MFQSPPGHFYPYLAIHEAHHHVFQGPSGGDAHGPTLHVAHEGRPQGTQRGNGHGAVLHVLGTWSQCHVVREKKCWKPWVFFMDIFCGI